MSERKTKVPDMIACLLSKNVTDLLSPGKHSFITKLTYCLRLVFLISLMPRLFSAWGGAWVRD